MEAFLEVLMWVGVVFATGVIAGFGKLLASWLVKRSRRGEPSAPPAPGVQPTTEPPPLPREAQPRESPQPPPQESKPPEEPAPTPPGEDAQKKRKKIQAKAEKKAEKERLKREKKEEKP